MYGSEKVKLCLLVCCIYRLFVASGGPGAVVKAACLESQRPRFRTPL